MSFHFLWYCFLAHQEDFFLYSSPRILAPSLDLVFQPKFRNLVSTSTEKKKTWFFFSKRLVFLATVWISEILPTYGPHWMEQLIEGLVASQWRLSSQCSFPISKEKCWKCRFEECFPVFGVVLNVPVVSDIHFMGSSFRVGFLVSSVPFTTISLYLACSWSYQRTFVSMKLYSWRIPALGKCFSTNKLHKPNMCLPNKPQIGHHGHGVDQIFFISTFCWTRLPLSGGVMYIYYIYIYTIYIYTYIHSQILNHLPRSAEAGFKNAVRKQNRTRIWHESGTSFLGCG